MVPVIISMKGIFERLDTVKDKRIPTANVNKIVN